MGWGINSNKSYLSVCDDVNLLCALCIEIVHNERVCGVEFGDVCDLRLAH